MQGLRTAAVIAATVALAALPGTAGANVPPRCDGLIVTIPGSDGPDSLVGTSGRDVIAAGDGNDRVFSGPGDDVVCLGAGNDSLNGGAGDDRLIADELPDGADSFAAGAGIDTADYAPRNVRVAVSLDNQPDDGTGAESDNMHVDVENVFGGRGRDTLRGNTAANTIFGGDDGDVIESGSGDDVLRGNLGNDILVPGLGDDSASGGDGDDLFVSEAVIDGADVFQGSSGVDTVSYAARTTGIRVFLDRAANDGALPFGEGDNVGSGGDVDHVIGGSGADVFNARAFFGGVWFEARDGNDSLTTTNGVADTADGGGGTDRCVTDPIDSRVSCES